MTVAKVGGLVFQARRSLPLSLRNVAFSVHVSDLLLIVLASVVSGCTYRSATGGVLGEVDQFATTGALVAVLIGGINIASGMNRPEELLKLAKQTRHISLAWLFTLFVVLGLAFTWKVSADVSRGAFLTFLVVGFPAMIGHRFLWHWLLVAALASERLKARRIAVLYPASEDAATVERLIGSLAKFGHLAVWRFAVPDGSTAARREDVVASLPKHLRGTDVEEILIVGDWASVPSRSELESLASLPVQVRFLPTGAARALCERRSERLGDSMLIDLQRGTLSGAERAAKAVFDRLAAGAGLLLLAPVLAFCALLIVCDDGRPIFFRQTRRGFNGRPFQIWKFRSMTATPGASFVRQAVVGDRRVTRVGRWLRRTSLDEIPQLINVLRGEMSLVGPRPHALSHDDHFDALIEDYFRRQHVRPGLTGWAQVMGARGETPTVEHMKCRVQLDIWYVQNWSFRRDLGIIMRTFWHVCMTDKAY